MRNKLSAEEMDLLLHEFETAIVPWCEANKLSLHRAFEISRETDPAKYKVLSSLWGTPVGKEYLRSCFKSRGGILK